MASIRANLSDNVHGHQRSARDALLHRTQARENLMDAMHHNRSSEDITRKCQNLTDTLPEAVIGCWQKEMFEVVLGDITAEPRDARIVDLIEDDVGDKILRSELQSRIKSWPIYVARELGTSMSFGMENQIAAFMISKRFERGSFPLQDLKNHLTGILLTWLTGSGTIYSNNELPRMMHTTTDPYKTDFNDTLNIESVIVSDSDRDQELFSIDTTSSYRVTSVIGVGTHGGTFETIRTGDKKTELTGEGSIYKLTYGTWVDIQNEVIRLGTQGPETGIFDHLAIQFGVNPPTE